MTRTLSVTRLLLAVVLVTAGAVSWAASDVSRDLADRRAFSATFRASPVVDDATWTPWRAPLARILDPEAERHTSIDAYWRGRYDLLSSPAATMPAGDGSLLTAANAAFRRVERSPTQPKTPADLDQVLDVYASALRNDGYTMDAAYNYEYVARLRDTLAQAKPAKPRAPGAATTTAPPQDDLPTGPTIHGKPGRHPPATRGNDFEVITPMDFGDREAQPEPTPGVKLPRKG
jgi:hypothetical protein